MQTVGALHAHEKADVEKGSAKVNNMFVSALGSVPYLTGGMSADDVISQERLRAIEEYRKMADSFKPSVKKE
jgi:hypothetical protein